MDNIFSENPKVDLYYKTSDDTAFFSQNSALNHAKTLTDKNVKKVTRDSVEKESVTNQEGKTVELEINQLSPSADSLQAEMLKTTPDDARTKVQEVIEKGAEDIVVVTEQFLTDGLTKKAETTSSQDVKLTPKQQLQADYQVKFGEVPSEEFTKQQLSEAIEKGEKLVTELKNDQ
ncbi:hypothetical protein GCM10022217_15820 [Chryseobacterium ginsenosidimutans]|uniref:hypothetical protein n=1 Tax=Chryseobacterium ginsenosidimutans TaxID=687846 RepID=UPI0031D36664